jgi:hypothetical protein
MNTRRIFFIAALALVASLLLATVLLVQASPQSSDLIGPAGSNGFGMVTVLPNGNLVVIDSGYSAPGPIAGVGAVYLYNGATGALISKLTGSMASDQIGSDGVTVLSNGNYVVGSRLWNNGVVTDAGALTWGSGTSGVTGTVSAANSLVGSTIDDKVGSSDVMELANGNYVVRNTNWDNGGAVNAGAVTWGSGTSGVSGAISTTNSLVGSTTNDKIGLYGVITLTNGNYVVGSYQWDNGSAVDAGAMTWGSGTTGVTGTVSVTNSLVGSTANDYVGYDGVTVLSNGNYVVGSSGWDNGSAVDAGAATWGSGTLGVKGAVSVTNSLVGSHANDSFNVYEEGGVYGVTALTNGNYVVFISAWDNGGVVDAGAATWGNGTIGVKGTISVTNSLVGSTISDTVGYAGVTALTNGNYVVSSSNWDKGGTTNAGAVTWGNGTTGMTGTVSVANSLVGSTSNDQVGYSVDALTNGNYVVRSTAWDKGGIVDAGAATWRNGTTSMTGTVSAANSLVGSTANDHVGNWLLPLTNGNYVVLSNNWDNGGAVDAGAVTWGNGTSGVIGPIWAGNSLLGFTANDQIGTSITELTNGNYLVRSSNWDNGGIADAGAVTWGSGTAGVTGIVSATNSLVGSTLSDNVGAYYVAALPNGNYVVTSFDWDNGGIVNAGAVTWGSGTIGAKGAISVTNSLVGSTASDQIGRNGVTALTNGNYVVISPGWNKGGTVNVGAVTWGSGTSGVTGVVSTTNSLVGSKANDQIGYNGVTALPNGSYVVRSAYWDNGGIVDAGAITFVSGSTCAVYPRIGGITAANSVLGSALNGGYSLNFGYDTVNQQLVVGRPHDNIVSLFTPNCFNVYLPLVMKNF